MLVSRPRRRLCPGVAVLVVAAVRRQVLPYVNALSTGPSRVVTTEHEVKRSRFVAHAARARRWEDAQAVLDAYSDPKARHNCYAWMSATSARSSDDGEPSGTAGKPIREAISGEACSDVIVLVTRYKPSTAPRLGAGGLIRAYGNAARLAVRALQDVDPDVAATHLAVETSELHISTPLKDVGALQQLVAGWERQDRVASRLSEDYDASGVTVVLRVVRDDADDLLEEAERRLGADAKVVTTLAPQTS